MAAPGDVFMPWLFEARGVYYDAMHRFVHPDGYRLSDRIWRASAKTRNGIDRLLQHEILNGTSAVKIADQLEEYLKRERAGVRTKKPYGRWGSYDARRLARTEITAAHGRATLASSAANPWVQTIRWALSAVHEDWDCNCKENSEKDVGYGPGVYPVEWVPDYPDHPHCMCNLQPQPAASPEEVVEQLRGELEAAWAAGEPAEGGGFFGMLGTLMTVPMLLDLWGMVV